MKAYPDKPKVIITRTETLRSDPQDWLNVSIDLLSNLIRTIAYPKQASDAVGRFLIARGLSEAAAERTVIDRLMDQSGTNAALKSSTSVLSIFEKANEQNINLVFIEKTSANLIESLDISNEAKIRISQSIKFGNTIIIPEESVDLNGNLIVGWFEYDPETGDFFDTLENGGHASLLEYLQPTINAIRASRGLAYKSGVVFGTFASIPILILRNDPAALRKAKDLISLSIAIIALDTFLGPFFSAGFFTAFAIAKLVAGKDPEIPDILVGLTENFSSDQNFKIEEEPFFTLPIGSAQSPSLYRLLIRNGSSTLKTYSLATLDTPAGFEAITSLSSVTIPAGEVGVVGVILIPAADGSLPAVGTIVPFSVQITEDGGSANTVSNTFTVPAIEGLSLDVSSSAIALQPGMSADITLTIQAIGNVTVQNAPLASVSSSGLSVSGVPQSVLLAPGDTQNIPITMTVGTETLNQTLNATVTAEFGQDLDGNPYQSQATVSITVRSAEVAAVENFALTATDADNPQLAQITSSIAENLSQLQQNPNDSTLCNRLALKYDQLLQLANVNVGLSSLITDIQALRNLAASCNTQQLLTSSQQFFQDNNSAIIASGSPAVALSPANLELEPGESGQLSLRLENQDSKSATFNLTLDPLPTGVTGQLNRTSITLAPGETLDANSANPVILTLNQSLNSTLVFPVRVTATLASNPGISLDASSLVAVRPALADVLSVTINPAVIEDQPGTAVSAQILNTANAERNVLARLEVLDDSNSVIQTLPNVPVTLETGFDPINVDFGQVSVTGLVDGAYRMRTSLFTVDGEQLPGRSAETLFFVGAPISAEVRAEPILVAPGNPTVTSIIEVTSQQDIGGSINPQTITVFSTDFESGVPSQIEPDTALIEGVQGYAGLGVSGNQFGGSFLRSPTGNTVSLFLSDLPEHTSISLDFLFAAIDSLDGTGTFPAGDFLP